MAANDKSLDEQKSLRTEFHHLVNMSTGNCVRGWTATKAAVSA